MIKNKQNLTIPPPQPSEPEQSGKAVTIADIALQCGVSKATVSRVMRNPQIVREPTRLLIQAALRDSGYSYNAAAGELGKQHNSIIGLIISGMTDIFFRSAVQSIQNMNLDYDLLIGDTNRQPYMEARLLSRFMERRARCVIMMGHCIGNDELIRNAERGGANCLMLWNKPDFEDCGYIGYDARLAMCQAVDHLAALGHREIGMVAGPYDRLAGDLRHVEGFKSALGKHGLSLHPGHLVMVEEGFPEAGRMAMTRLLSAAPRPTAVVMVDDILAVGAYAALKRFNLSAPGDLSVVGMGNIDFAAHMDPPLTTVHIPMLEMSGMAGQHIAGVLKGEKEKCRILLPTALMARGSTAPVKG